MAVRKLDSRRFEAVTTEIAEQANKLRKSQDELRSLYDQMTRNRGELRKGAIGRDAFQENMKRMREDEDMLKRRIRKTVSRKLMLLSRAATTMKSQRIGPKKKKRRRRR